MKEYWTNVQIGDKAHYFINTNDIMSLQVLEVYDVYEVSLQETYAKLIDYPFKIEFGEKIIGKYGEGTPPYERF